MKFFTLFSPPPSVPSRVSTPSRTRQEFARECDINFIVARVGAGLEVFPPVDSQYRDFSDVPNNYEDMLNSIIDAQERFSMLPSALRDRFGNDPSKLLAFLRVEENREEAIRLGLVASRTSVSENEKPQSKPNLNSEEVLNG